MLTRKKRRAQRGRALIERMEERCLLSAALPNGTANAMAYDAGGKLWVAYYDTADKDLKYAVRDTNGAWSAPQVVDEGLKGAANEDTPAADAQVGEYVSMVIERGGTPGVAYFDAYWSNLKYAHFNATTQQWDVQHVDSAGRVGTYPSISYSAATGAVAISYFSASAGQLRLTQLNSTGWGGSTTSSAPYDVVDGSTTAVVGRFNVLAYNPGWGRWAIGYDDSANGAAKYAYQRTGNVWVAQTVDSAPSSDVAFTSIAFDGNKRPALAYYDTGVADLKFAKGADVSGTSWSVETPVSKNTAGKYSNLFYDPATDKFTIYYNLEAGGVTKINYVTGNTGVTWSDARTLYSGGGSEDHVLKTPGVAGGVTYSWSAVDAFTGQQNLYVNDSTTGTVWRQETAEAGFSTVRDTGAVVHMYNGQSRIYVIDGYSEAGQPGVTGTHNTDSSVVRASGDGGVTWSYWVPQGANGGPAPVARHDQTVASFAGKLWMIGGESPTGDFLNDVWSSPDGVTWTREADLPAGFAPRSQMASAVSGDGSTLYLIGGQGAPPAGGILATNYADVWSMTAGHPWAQATGAAPFGARHRAAAVFFNNRLWLLGGEAGALVAGGTAMDDAWFSTDGGATWTCATATGGYGGRSGLNAVVHDNRMWVMGGEYYYGGTLNTRPDVWYSFDGVSWTLAGQGPATSRVGGGAVEFGGRIVSLFGTTPTYGDDVWSAA